MSKRNRKTLSLEENPQKSYEKKRHESYSVLTSSSYQNDGVKANRETPSLDSLQISLNSSDQCINQFLNIEEQTLNVNLELGQNVLAPNALPNNKPKKNKAEFKPDEKDKKKNFKPVLADRRVNSEKKLKKSKDFSKVQFNRKKDQPVSKIRDFAEKSDRKIKILPPEVIFDHDKLEARWAKAKIIESHELYEPGSQAHVILSEVSSRNSVGSELEDSLMSSQAKKLQLREPSFGLGGGEFASFESQKESSKVVQTDQKISNFQELLNMITDKEFINSLKIIGKFASFLERNLNNVSE